MPNYKQELCICPKGIQGDSSGYCGVGRRRRAASVVDVVVVDVGGGHPQKWLVLRSNTLVWGGGGGARGPRGKAGTNTTRTLYVLLRGV